METNNQSDTSDSTNEPPTVEDEVDATNPVIRESVECLDLSRHCNLHLLLEENDFIGEDRALLITHNGYETPSLMSVDNLSISPVDTERNSNYVNSFEREIMIGNQPLISFWNHFYNEEDRQLARFRVEMFSRDLCIIYCVLGQMLLTEEEILGRRDVIPSPEEARQILLMMTVGTHWDVLNLCMILNMSEKIQRMTRYGNCYTIYKTMSREFMENTMRSCLGIWERESYT